MPAGGKAPGKPRPPARASPPPRSTTPRAATSTNVAASISARRARSGIASIVGALLVGGRLRRRRLGLRSGVRLAEHGRELVQALDLGPGELPERRLLPAALG